MKEHEILPLSGAKSNFSMIDVGDKRPTKRKAIAQGRIAVGKEAFDRICSRQMPKGDVLAMAEVAGIMAAKKTSDLLPLCHPLPLESVSVSFKKEKETHSFWVYCCASTTSKTGVEMEALSGVHGALLSIYDLTKMIEPALSISDIRLNRKEGGKKGVWVHPDADEGRQKEPAQIRLEDVSSRILTVSDRCSRLEAIDRSGPVICEFLKSRGATITESRTVPDSESQIAETVLAWSKSTHLIVTTGGTGLGPRDVTIQALKQICTKEVPGIGELIRQQSAAYTNKTWLSASTAFLVGKALVLALPGSEKAVKETLSIVEDLLPHALHICRGGNHG